MYNLSEIGKPPKPKDLKSSLHDIYKPFEESNIKEFTKWLRKQNIPFIQNTPTYTRDTILSFGKYKGLTIYQVLQKDQNYLRWCVIDNKMFNVTEDILRLITPKVWDKPIYNLRRK